MALIQVPEVMKTSTLSSDKGDIPNIGYVGGSPILVFYQEMNVKDTRCTYVAGYVCCRQDL